MLQCFDVLFVRKLWAYRRRLSRLRVVSGFLVLAVRRRTLILPYLTFYVGALSRFNSDSQTLFFSSLLGFSSVALLQLTSGVRKNSVPSKYRSDGCFFVAPEPMQMGDHVVTQKSLYTGLFVIGLPLLWWSSPLGTFFWLVGASGVLIFLHASVIEPGVESEYASVQEGV